MTKQNANNGNVAMVQNVMVATAKGFVAHNAPKMNSVAIACDNIKAIAANGLTVDGLTALGHKAQCKGGIIDATILKGNVHSIEAFITALMNSNLNVVNNDIKVHGLTDTLKAVLAKRVVDHVTWCSDVLNQSHGGFADRLQKVGLQAQRAEIGHNLVELASALKAQFSAHYSKLYKNR